MTFLPCCLSSWLARRIVSRKTSRFRASMAIPTTCRYAPTSKQLSNIRLITAWRFFCTALGNDNGRPPTPAALLPRGLDGSTVVKSWRESSDREGSIDCEKGVVGELRPAEVLALPFMFVGKAVVS